MNLNGILTTCGLAHVIICCVIFLCVWFKLLHVPMQMMPLILLIPGVGLIAAIVVEIITLLGQNGSMDISVEDPHLHYTDTRLHRIEQEVYQDIIPIQEALLVNDTKIRRELIRDVLCQTPEDYVQQLQEACTDKDMEVSHYASTAMMELQKEYEMGMQQAEAEYMKNPEDAEKLQKAIDSMQLYIGSGLINPSIVMVYRNRFADLLEKQIALDPENMYAMGEAVDNYLAMEKTEDAKRLSDAMIQHWPHREQGWLKQLKVFYTMNDGEGIRKTLEQMQSGDVYLSHEGKGAVKFWQGSCKKEVQRV